MTSGFSRNRQLGLSPQQLEFIVELRDGAFQARLTSVLRPEWGITNPTRLPGNHTTFMTIVFISSVTSEILFKQFGIVLECGFCLRLLLTFKVYAFANHEISRFDDNLKCFFWHTFRG